MLQHAKLQAGDVRVRGDLPHDMAFALCETPHDVARAATEPALRDVPSAIVALTPEAAWQCLRSGRAYYKLEDFFDEEIFCSVSGPMIALQREWLDRLDALLFESIPQFRAARFEPARMHGFFLKIVSDELFMCACALAHFFVTARPTRVVYFAGPPPRDVTWDLCFDESVYALILAECARVYDVPLMTVPGRPGPSRRPTSVLRVLSPRQKAWLRSLRSFGVAGLARRLIARDTAPLLVFKHGYDVSIVARLALAQGWQCREFAHVARPLGPAEARSAELPTSLASLWPKIDTDRSFSHLFQWFGVDLWPVARPRVHYWWHHVIDWTWRVFTTARNRLGQHPPAGLLVWSPFGPIDEGVLHAGRTLGIPTATYQHGGFEGSCDFIANELSDLRAADYRFVYGAGVADYYGERASLNPAGRAEVIAVGSARLDSLRARPSAARVRNLRRRCGAHSGQAVVLYVPTMYMRHRRYMSCEDYGNVPYFELQARIVETMRRFPMIRFIYKPFPKPTADPIVEMIETRCHNCRIVDDVPLPRLVWAADLHVIDIPSTGLLEALLTPKSIVALADKRYIRLRPEARALLEKRVTLADNPDAFCDRLRERLSGGTFEDVADPNQEFLRTYGLHQDDGQSAARVLAVLAGLAGKPARQTVSLQR